MAIRNLPACVCVMFAGVLLPTDVRGQMMVFPFTSTDHATLGAIPDSPGPGCGIPGPPRDVLFRPFTNAGVGAVDVSLTLTHPAAGQVSATLIAPDGTTYALFGRRGVQTATDCGSPAPLDGHHSYSVSMRLPAAPAASATGATVSTAFTPGAFWTVRLIDWGAGGTGAVEYASLSFQHPRLPGALPDAYDTRAGVPLVVAAPGVLANDRVGAESFQVITPMGAPNHGHLSVEPDGAFTYVPYPGFAGSDRFWYFVLTDRGVAFEVVTVVVRGATAPTDVGVAAIAGSRVVLRWQAPSSGARPTGYRLDWRGGPGDAAGAIDLPASPTAFAIDVPSGRYAFSMHTLSDEGPSPPSADVSLSTDVADAPSPPADLRAGVHGDHVTLQWAPTFTGGPATHTEVALGTSAVAGELAVSGSAVALAGMPLGEYWLTARTVGPGGTSAYAGIVRFDVPGRCQPPATPVRFAAFVSPGRLGAVWDPAPEGGIPTRYEVAVSRPVNAMVPVGLQRVHEVPMPPGEYRLQVRAVNTCGTSTLTPPQTVVVP
jgi:Bacterial Ig domain/Proprotein convertase P-domain